MIARQTSRLTPNRLSRKALTGAALSLALAAAVLTVPSLARAAEDEEVPFDSKILRGVLETLGLRKDGEAINYQERAPLVIPPSRTLPPPERSDAVIANNPAWPKDPDVQRSKAAKAAAAKEAYVSADEKFRNESRVLSPNELTPGATAASARRTASGPGTASTFSETNQRMTPSQLGSTGSLWDKMFGRRDDDVAKFTGEPARTSLTEPPPGYQTPSPDQPYGLSARTTAPKATNYLLEKGVADPTK